MSHPTNFVLRRQNATAGADVNVRTRRWCFVINNYTEDELNKIDDVVRVIGHDVRYLVVGVEVGQEGTPHLQGYLETNKTQRRAAIVKIEGLERAWVHAADGNKEKNFTYCTKDGNWREFGKPLPGKAGKRTDLEAVHEALTEGDGLREISQNFFPTFVRYHGGLQRYLDLNLQPSTRSNMKILWFWGPTGSGKTSLLKWWLNKHEQDGLTGYWLQTSPTSTWWTGYAGEQVVLMDEVRRSWFPHGTALRIFDRNPYRVPIHGGNVPLNCEYMLVSSNKPPHMMYEIDDAGALMRRINDYATVYEVQRDCVYVRNVPNCA